MALPVILLLGYNLFLRIIFSIFTFELDSESFIAPCHFMLFFPVHMPSLIFMWGEINRCRQSFHLAFANTIQLMDPGGSNVVGV